MATQKIEKLSISGLHCRSCEISAEDALCKIPGISKAKVSHEKGEAELELSSDKLPLEDIRNSLKKLGYSLGNKKKSHPQQENLDPSEKWSELFIAIIVVSVLAIIVKMFGWINIAQPTATNLNYFSILVVGLIAGISSCLVLVGGLVLGSAADFAKKHPQITGLKKFEPHLVFNLGRIAGFFFLGGILGLAGSAFKISALGNAYLSLIIGFVIIFLGIKVLDLFPFFNKDFFLLPKSLARYLGIKNEHKEYSKANVLISGALTFFLPCGFTQAMQIYAISTGSFWSGALTMAIFALGTAPGLLSLGGIMSLIKGKMSSLLFKLAGLIIIVLGVINIVNSSKIINSFQGSSEIATKGNSINNQGEKQVINMIENSRGYSPNILKVKVGKPVKWVIDSQDKFSCASALVVPALKIEKQLKPGENVIEFTPTAPGKINFSCSMGMYSGYIEVTP